MPRLPRLRSKRQRQIDCEAQPSNCKKRKTLFASAQDTVTGLVFGKEIVTDKRAFHDCVDRAMDGREVKMDKFRGKVCVVVNVASKCGLTKANYVQLSALYDQYHAQGLRLLAFPCNQFAKQEPGTHEEILTFVEKNFGAKAKFEWFAKGHVNGRATREVYSFLKSTLPADDDSADVRWNFAKFLVDHQGVPFKRYSPTFSPKNMVGDIEELLRRKEAES